MGEHAPRCRSRCDVNARRRGRRGVDALLERFGEARFTSTLAGYEALPRPARRTLTARRVRRRRWPTCSRFRARARLSLRLAVQRDLRRARRVQGPDGHPQRRARAPRRGARGRALVKAARFAALARGGEILASGVTRELADLDEVDGDMWFGDETRSSYAACAGAMRSRRCSGAVGRPAARRVADDAGADPRPRRRLLRENGLEVVANPPATWSPLRCCRPAPPDVALVSIRMPPRTPTKASWPRADLRS